MQGQAAALSAFMVRETGCIKIYKTAMLVYLHNYAEWCILLARFRYEPILFTETPFYRRGMGFLRMI